MHFVRLSATVAGVTERRRSCSSESFVWWTRVSARRPDEDGQHSILQTELRLDKTSNESVMNRAKLPPRAFLNSHTPPCTCTQFQLRWAENALGKRSLNSDDLHWNCPISTTNTDPFLSETLNNFFLWKKPLYLEIYWAGSFLNGFIFPVQGIFVLLLSFICFHWFHLPIQSITGCELGFHCPWHHVSFYENNNSGKSEQKTLRGKATST